MTIKLSGPTVWPDTTPSDDVAAWFAHQRAIRWPEKTKGGAHHCEPPFHVDPEINQRNERPDCDTPE